MGAGADGIGTEAAVKCRGADFRETVRKGNVRKSFAAAESVRSDGELKLVVYDNKKKGFCVSVCFELSDLFHGVFLQNVI